MCYIQKKLARMTMLWMLVAFYSVCKVSTSHILEEDGSGAVPNVMKMTDLNSNIAKINLEEVALIEEEILKNDVPKEKP